MTRRPNASKTDLNRVLDVLQARGETWGAIRVQPGGNVLVMRQPPTEAAPDLDRERQAWLDGIPD